MRWRDETSKECQADFDSLLDEVIGLAAERIATNWGLTPFALVVDARGVKGLVGTLDDDADGVTMSDTPIRDRVVDRVASLRDEVRSVAVVSQVIPEGSKDTEIEVLLEHREFALQILVPYEMPDSTTFNLGTMRAAKSTHLVWT
ncbi:hypothetical protein ASG12_18920 [Williamsia sp. Leaf354]|jgi:hypothetical protein|uniref:hypothetical protein n=1 Tax=Williamsia sp. Leaf354 TaxID=1736349 RepID=UPI0006F389D0|nr:hypothetical protein [Williamsia sp. Leaf354]KQR96265.1 hypothetical protein ASG12_18920 [Williamsia sp. Leaf354]